MPTECRLQFQSPDAISRRPLRPRQPRNDTLLVIIPRPQMGSRHLAGIVANPPTLHIFVNRVGAPLG
jgi:hypothetical protein